MSELRPDGTPYPADEDSAFGRWLRAWLAATGLIHDAYFTCSDLRAAYYAGVADAGDENAALREALTEIAAMAGKTLLGPQSHERLEQRAHERGAFEAFHQAADVARAVLEGHSQGGGYRESEPLPDEYMCPNCVTPWKCNGPHIPQGGGNG